MDIAQASYHHPCNLPLIAINSFTIAIIYLNNTYLIFGLVVPAISSRVTSFSTYITSHLGPFYPPEFLKLFCSTLGPRWFFILSCFFLPFALTSLNLNYPAASNFSLTFDSSSIQRCFWIFSSEKSFELCKNFFLYLFHEADNFAIIALTWEASGIS